MIGQLVRVQSTTPEEWAAHREELLNVAAVAFAREVQSLCPTIYNRWYDFGLEAHNAIEKVRASPWNWWGFALETAGRMSFTEWVKLQWRITYDL